MLDFSEKAVQITWGILLWSQKQGYYNAVLNIDLKKIMSKLVSIETFLQISTGYDNLEYEMVIYIDNSKFEKSLRRKEPEIIILGKNQVKKE